jgi:uncharacterized integral membrane protein
MSIKSLLMSVVLAILFSWFALANSQAVTVSLLLWNYQVPLFLVILISMMLGILFTGLISAVEENKLMGKLKDLEKTLKKSEKQEEKK